MPTNVRPEAMFLGRSPLALRKVYSVWSAILDFALVA
jgi:hypothetical protein